MHLNHIFYIHSNITYLASLSIIEELELREPILLFGRGYTNDSIKNNYTKIVLDEYIDTLNDVPSSGSAWLIFKYAISIRYLKQLITKYGKNGYICYLPHVKNFLMQYFVMHKACKHFCIIEDGLLSYSNTIAFIKQTNRKYTSTISGRILRFLKYFNHLNSSSVYFPIKANLVGVYLFYDSQDKNRDIKPKILSWPKLNIELPDYSNRKIFIIDNLDSNNFLDKKNYLSVYRSIFKEFYQMELFIKFHPANKPSLAVINLLDEQRINYRIIPPNIPLELVFLKSKSLKIYGLFSSLLFYAAIMGHESVSFAKHADLFDERISPMMKKLMPAVFFEKVNLK